MRITVPNRELEPEDERDIRESFDVLDEEKIGVLPLEAFQTLWLGLGYGRIELEDLNVLVQEELQRQSISQLTIDVVLAILSTRTRNRTEEISKCFRLLDADRTGSISAENLAKMSKDAGDPVTLQEAKAMLGDEEWSLVDLGELLSRDESQS